jgi:uncharacterized protein YqeY
MGVREDLDAALKAGMRAKDETALNAIRGLKSAMKLAEIDKKKTLADEDIPGLIQAAIKQRRDSITQFRQGAREDLALVEEAQLAVLQKFLPPQLSVGEIAALVAGAVKATGAATPRDMGKVMGALMPKVKGKADGALVNAAVKKALGA